MMPCLSKNLSDKHSQKFLDHAKQSGTGALAIASKRKIWKTAESNSDLIGSKIADRVTKVTKSSQQNNSETGTNGHDKGIPKERYITPEERQKIIDDVRLI